MFTKTLGPISANLIAQLQRSGKVFFTIDDAVQIHGKSRFATGDLLSELVKRGVLARIKSKTYLILQTGAENTQLKNWPVIARELAGGNPYFISHYSAMRLHGMTTHPLFDVYITFLKRRKDIKLSGITYHFIYCKEEHFWGTMTHWATKQDQVQVSDLEKTILDGLDRPDLCGGLTEIVRGIWIKQREIDQRKLIQYSQKFRTRAAIKRLGFILETLNMFSDCISFLQEQIVDAKDYVLLDPTGPREGKFLSRWRLQLNTSLEEMKESVWG